MNAKTLEYKEKGLSGKDGQNITVVPPHEYQERLCPLWIATSWRVQIDGPFIIVPDPGV